MELEQFYRSLPKFTRFYMIAIFATTFIKSYVKLPIIPYLDLDFDLVLTNFHVWRLFTNFFIVGKFSFNFLFFLIMIYNTFSRLEKKSTENKRYAEFIMLILYTVGFLLLVTWLMSFLFGLEVKRYLSFEFLFALIYIEAKRDPEKMVMVWMITCKNAHVPFVLLFFSLLTGGDIVSDLIGIAGGHIYYYLKDLAPIHHNLDLLKTPQFLINYFNTPQQNQSNRRSNFSTVNNSNSSGSFDNNQQQNAQPNISTSFRQDNSGTGNRFQPFSGRGNNWG